MEKLFLLYEEYLNALDKHNAWIKKNEPLEDVDVPTFHGFMRWYNVTKRREALENGEIDDNR